MLLLLHVCHLHDMSHATTGNKHEPLMHQNIYASHLHDML